MALTYEGMIVTVPDAPDGYEAAPVNTFNDGEWKRSLSVTVSAITVDNADPIVGFTALFDAVDSAVLNALLDFNSITHTLDAYANFRFSQMTTGVNYENDQLATYSCVADIFIKSVVI